MSKQIKFSYALLTYKTHLDKALYSAWLQDKVECKQILIAHETGDEQVPYEHTHVVIHTSARYSTRDQSMRDFDYLEIHPNIKILVGAKAFKDAVKYISKEDKTVVAEEPSICDKVWECASVQDALSAYALRPSDVPGIIALYNMKPKVTPWPSYELRPGPQQQMYDLIKDAHSDRHVYWIRSGGGQGKSVFMKYMLQNHPNDTLIMTYMEHQKDIAQSISSAQESGCTVKYILINCTMSYTFKSTFYTCLESIKDGFISCPKFKSHLLTFNNSVLVVMSNVWPDTRRLMLDRWQCYEANSDGLTRKELDEVFNVPE